MMKTRRPGGSSQKPRSTDAAVQSSKAKAPRKTKQPTDPPPGRIARTQIMVNFFGSDLEDIRARAALEGGLPGPWIRDKAVKALRGLS